MKSSVSGIFVCIAGTLLAYVTVLGGHSVVQNQLTDPLFGGILWPVSVAGAVVVILAVAVVMLMILLGIFEGIAPPELLGRTTVTLIGGAGFVGTGLGALRIAAAWILDSGGEPTLNSLTAVALIAIPLGYVSYLLWQVERLTLSQTTNEEHLDPEFVRDKTAQWATEEQTQYQSSADKSAKAVDPREIRAESQPSNRSSQNERSDLTELEFDWTTETGVDFENVGGMKELKAELKRDVVRPLTTHRDKAEKLGITPTNILFYGPPGTGKTHLAEALATELGLPFVKLSGAEVQSKWINESAQSVNTLFEEARRVAEHNGGAVIFLDELDTVLKKRTESGNAHEEDNKVVNEFLNQLEGADHGIVFIGATNRPESLDSAGVRPGRIDKKIHIGMPDCETRSSILKAQLRDRPHTLTDEQIAAIAERTDGMSAADLSNLVEQAARSSLFQREDTKITQEDMYRVLVEIDSAETHRT